jgi:hypothetical protein
MPRRQSAAGAIVTGAALAVVCACVVAAAAAPHTARATVTVHGKRFGFTGGRCRRAVHGLEVTIGRVRSRRYFRLEYILTRKSGTYRNGGIVTIVVGRSAYISQHGQLRLTLRNGARSGTFSGKLTSGGAFRGSFRC